MFLLSYLVGIYMLKQLGLYVTPAKGAPLPTRAGDATEEGKSFRGQVSEFNLWLRCITAMTAGVAASFLAFAHTKIYGWGLIIYLVFLVVLVGYKHVQHMLVMGYRPWAQKKKTFI